MLVHRDTSASGVHGLLLLRQAKGKKKRRRRGRLSDYIKRDSFIEDTVRKHCDDCNRRKNADGKTVYALGDAPCRACNIADLVDDIDDFPAADVRENQRGKWEDSFDGITPYCSVCGHAHSCLHRTPNFCPN